LDHEGLMQQEEAERLQACQEIYRARKELGQAFEFSQKKILVVDDESYNCKALFQIMKALKLPNPIERVLKAYSGKQALRYAQQSIHWEHEDNQLLRRRVSDIGLVLTDCSMPRMDGYECAQKMKQMFRVQSVENPPKIYAVTGHVEPEYKAKAIESGMVNVLPKPVNLDILQMLLLQNKFEIQLKPNMVAFFESLEE
jgi:CheY-like chemotaxis protein